MSPTPGWGFSEFRRYFHTRETLLPPPHPPLIGSFQNLSFVTVRMDENGVPTTPLTYLFHVPQAWLGVGTWEVPSLLLVTLSVILITTLVRCLLT